ncbi:hypothetical protein ACO0K0_11420 [Undibacterium sp. SXout11W]|uniref:hypothetical protein n=1 Tax=Undibacterium sp. SXout11W TaxID=3413050 RepID=UPI003BF2C7A0
MQILIFTQVKAIFSHPYSSKNYQRDSQFDRYCTIRVGKLLHFCNQVCDQSCNQKSDCIRESLSAMPISTTACPFQNKTSPYLATYPSNIELYLGLS